MREKIAGAALLAMVAGLLTIAGPAQAQATPMVAVLEGVGNVCSASGLGNCVYDMNDPLWGAHKLTNNPPRQGLFAPGLGPAGRGPFSFSAGRATNPPSGLCISTTGGPGCLFTSSGDLLQGEAAGALGNGAYCGSSKGVGTASFSPAVGSGQSGFTSGFGWRQSAGTILPLEGATSTGQTLVGFVSARGLSGGGNCGVTDPTTAFQVEGLVAVF